MAIPLEQELNGTPNMLYMSSKSTNSGSSNITITFDVGTDPNLASVDVHLSADGLNLVSGSGATVSLPKSATKMATLVPRDALIVREKETFILTVDENDEAQKINVLVGLGIAEWVSVSGNINAGTEVIIRGAERLQSGDKVRCQSDLVAKR